MRGLIIMFNRIIIKGVYFDNLLKNSNEMMFDFVCKKSESDNAIKSFVDNNFYKPKDNKILSYNVEITDYVGDISIFKDSL